MSLVFVPYGKFQGQDREIHQSCSVTKTARGFMEKYARQPAPLTVSGRIYTSIHILMIGQNLCKKLPTFVTLQYELHVPFLWDKS